MNQVSIEPAELSAIAVTTGPGSFTGLRVGVALSKAMSYALGIETIEVDTLHAMAYPFQLAENYHTFGNDEAINNKIKSLAFGDRVRLWTILDAYRGEFFVASWNIVKYQKHAELVRESETQIVDAETWCSLALNSLDEVNSHNEIDTATTEVIVTGAGVKKLRNSIDRVNQKVESVCGKPISVMEGVVPTSDSVARIGFEFLQQGQTVNPFELMPVYLRGSAAEEKKRK